jgi:uncharacterized protein YciU (UPF0263 family)
MAVVLTLKWPGCTKAQYDQLLELADWENEPARNGIFHVVWWEGDTMGIVDVWESQQDWQNFFDERLSPHFEAVRVTGQPDAQFHDVYRYFNTQASHAAA